MQKKGTPWELLLQSFRVDPPLDRPRAENKAVTAGTEAAAMPQRFIAEIKSTPTFELYIDELQNVNQDEKLDYEEYLNAPRPATVY